MSLPARERGLKLSHCNRPFPPAQVAPRAGAWIETYNDQRLRTASLVAPRAGAWIETRYNYRHNPLFRSLPARERGLKQLCYIGMTINCMSLPARERGLKHSFPFLSLA